MLTFFYVLAFYLLCSSRNAFGNQIITDQRLRRQAGWMIFAEASLYLVNIPLYYVKDVNTVQVVSITMDLLVGFPLIFRFLFSLLQDKKHLPDSLLWLFLIPLVPLILWFITHNVLLIWILFVVSICLIAFFVLLYLRSLREYRSFLLDNFADLESKEVMWSYNLIIAFTILEIVYFIAWSQVSSLSYMSFWPFLFQIMEAALMAFIVLRIDRQQVLTVPSNTGPQEDIQEDYNTIEPTEKEEETVGDPVVSRMEILLKKFCEEPGLYRQQDLSLSALASACGTNRTYLGRYFSANGVTYNSYINGLRISWFQNAMLSAMKGDPKEVPSIKSLSIDSGFSSYDTFSRAFHSVTGTSVKQWLLDMENKS